MMHQPHTQAPRGLAGGVVGLPCTQPTGPRTTLGKGTRNTRAGRLRRAAVLAVGVLAVGLTLAACDRPLDANSSCQDFLRAPIQTRDSAVKDVALALHLRGAGSPLVLPNVEYLCGNSPAATLGNAVQHSAS